MQRKNKPRFRTRLATATLILGCAAPAATSCGPSAPSAPPTDGSAQAPDATSAADDAPPAAAAPSAAASALRVALDGDEPIVLAPEADVTTDAGRTFGSTIRGLADAERSASADLIVDYPLDESMFPPGFVPPTFLWHDSTAADAWLVTVDLPEGDPIRLLVSGPPEPAGWIDDRAIGDTNELYTPTEYQQSAHSWEVPDAVWAAIQRRSVETEATVTFEGILADAPAAVLSSGSMRLITSKDEVGAPVFYRDVPLMPSVSKVDGVIKPLAQEAVPIIEWRLRDLTQKRSKLVLTGMRTCANCHSFSLDGKTMGMDVDGPQGDKGAYTMVPLAKRTEVDDEHVLSWNAFPGRLPDTKTIGFLSRISPNGRYAITTLNEQLYVANFVNYRFLQVFYPTRGILGWTDSQTGDIKALPGADNPDFVHCGAAWMPDGKSIVFTRGKGFDAPAIDIAKMARYPNDELEPTLLFDLYRMPFDGGRGGKAVPIEGASGNGMSNTFPKVSPDGKWIVFTQCRNGLLMRPDGRLKIIPVEGGEPRDMRCNTPLMNSWHSWSPNSRWMVFSSKSRRPYTQLFLTHIDENGNDTPAVLVPNCTADNRAVNLPEFLNASIDSLDDIAVPKTGHNPVDAYYEQSLRLMLGGNFEAALPLLEKATRYQPDYLEARVNYGAALKRTNRIAQAMEQYQRALEIDPGNGRAHGALVSLRAWQGGGRPDLEQLRAAAKAPGASLDNRRRLAIALAQADNRDEGVPLLESLIKGAPDDVELRRELAHLHLSHGDGRAATPHLIRIAGILPEDVPTQLLLAWQWALGAEGVDFEPRRATEAAAAACRLTKYSDAHALDALAAALAAAGEYPAAVERATAAQQLAKDSDPSLAEWIGKRAQLYRERRRLGK